VQHLPSEFVLSWRISSRVKTWLLEKQFFSHIGSKLPYEQRLSWRCGVCVRKRLHGTSLQPLHWKARNWGILCKDQWIWMRCLSRERCHLAKSFWASCLCSCLYRVARCSGYQDSGQKTEELSSVANNHKLHLNCSSGQKPKCLLACENWKID